MTKHGGGIGAPTKEERMKEAANLHVKTGNIRRYCELMVELGQVVFTHKDMLKSETAHGLGFTHVLCKSACFLLLSASAAAASPVCLTRT